ncbi:MAG: FxDxF family PEP-CTERM protein [Pseudomonadota bacterium]|jgi:hypothetical protein
MRQVKKLAGAFLVAGATLLSHGAMAADVSNAPSALNLADGVDFFGHQVTGNHAGDIFSDRYTFSLAAGSSIFADTFSSSGNAKNGFDILDLSLFNADGLVLKGTQLLTGKTDQWELSSAPLSAGSYYLQVTGTVLSKAAGAYTGSATVTAVPEPETYGMLLGGLGLVGVVAARRQRKQGGTA